MAKISIDEFDKFEDKIDQFLPVSFDRSFIRKLRNLVSSHMELEAKYQSLQEHDKQVSADAGKFYAIVNNFKLSEDAKELIK